MINETWSQKREKEGERRGEKNIVSLLAKARAFRSTSQTIVILRLHSNEMYAHPRVMMRFYALRAKGVGRGKIGVRAIERKCKRGSQSAKCRP